MKKSFFYSTSFEVCEIHGLLHITRLYYLNGRDIHLMSWQQFKRNALPFSGKQNKQKETKIIEHDRYWFNKTIDNNKLLLVNLIDIGI